MLRFDRQFFKWLLIGAVFAVVADGLLYPLELLVIAARDAGSLGPPVALGIVALAAALITALALVAIGERAWSGPVVAAAATVIGYLIGATHLAALSLGVSVATFGDRRERGRPPLKPRVRSAVRPAPTPPDGSRPASRRRRRRRR